MRARRGNTSLQLRVHTFGIRVQSAQADTCLQTPTSQLDLGYMRQPRALTPLNTSTGA
ncbi:hypothetical protein XFF6990_140476 [Xanthomonas citri pv. fuscans]|uniref:Uncharacterized protein n=1 Tax=Xanthomonas campestris pv. phaseoli TaxID=317013 RepID=A0A7Z7IVN1_XANCH|nr:hypothetical protein XFF6990_140476 [Xanthomonas citri pv. fuscans]SOO22415.1 hypothetical protein XFF6991_150176 [Xanthomonas phaseoli pv. phaseoli]